MKKRWISSSKFLVIAGTFTVWLAGAHAQQPAAASSDSVGTIKVESRIVLVDSVVTDKHGNYVRDLEAKDFKVWEDGKEQPVTSFTREDDSADPAHPAKHYLVLFFD